MINKFFEDADVIGKVFGDDEEYSEAADEKKLKEWAKKLAEWGEEGAADAVSKGIKRAKLNLPDEEYNKLLAMVDKLLYKEYKRRSSGSSINEADNNKSFDTMKKQNINSLKIYELVGEALTSLGNVKTDLKQGIKNGVKLSGTFQDVENVWKVLKEIQKLSS